MQLVLLGEIGGVLLHCEHEVAQGNEGLCKKGVLLGVETLLPRERAALECDLELSIVIK